jgi:altronate hydrolase
MVTRRIFLKKAGLATAVAASFQRLLIFSGIGFGAFTHFKYPKNKIQNMQSQPLKNRFIRLHPTDNLAVALDNLPGGIAVSFDNLSFALSESIPVKHKFALSDIAVGGTVYLYGIKVGKAIKAIPQGTAITTENTVNATSDIQRNTSRNFKWTPPGIEFFKNKSFMGYYRADGQVGTANHWIVIPMVFCENRNLEVIKDAVLSELGYQGLSPYHQFTKELVSLYQKGASANDLNKINQLKIETYADKIKLFKNITGVQFLIHDGGCGGTRQDAEALCGLLAGYITNPNVAGATVVSLGCQNAQLSILQQEIKKRDPGFSKPYFEFEQQKIGTEEEMIKQAIQSIFTGLKQANKIERKPAPLSKLCIGLECGGSDGFSGISANPAVGNISDLIVALGGSTILSEFPELSGVEQNLYERCVSQLHADKFLDLMQAYNSRAKAAGSGFDMNPSPGNIRDGLITDAMKSAGAAKKGGTSPITGVLDYPEKVGKPGLHLLCTPGNDVESVTAEVAAGANIVLFTTGLGTPTGNPIVPVIKVSTNTTLYVKMPDIIDINTGTIIDGEETIEHAAERILNYVIDVASGVKEPATKRNGQADFIQWKQGVSL